VHAYFFTCYEKNNDKRITEMCFEHFNTISLTLFYYKFSTQLVKIREINSVPTNRKVLIKGFLISGLYSTELILKHYNYVCLFSKCHFKTFLSRIFAYGLACRNIKDATRKSKKSSMFCKVLFHI